MCSCAIAHLDQYETSIPVRRCCCDDTKVLLGVLFLEKGVLDETQFAGTGNRLCAPLDLKFLVDISIVSLDGILGDKQAFTDLAIRETLGNKL